MVSKNHTMNRTWIRNVITTGSIALMVYGFIMNKYIFALPTALVLLLKDTELFKDEFEANRRVDSIFLCINMGLLLTLVGYYIINKTMN